MTGQDQLTDLCRAFTARAEPHRQAYRTGRITYTELRRRLLALRGEMTYERRVTGEDALLSSDGKRALRERLVQQQIDHGHPLVPMYPTAAEAAQIAGEA